MNAIEKRARLDWTLLIFIIPIGVILIVIVGQLAVRWVPAWSVNADMKSNLEPDLNADRPFALLQPLLPQLLTPMAWAESYLTPGAEVSFPPFLTFEPTASLSPTLAPPTATEATPTKTPSPTASATTPAPTGTSVTPSPSDKCEDPDAENFGDSLPCKYSPPPPTATTPVVTATSPTPSSTATPPTPTATATSPTPTATATSPTPTATTTSPTPTATGTPAAIPTGYTQVSPPVAIGTNAPDNNIGGISDGSYTVIDFSSSPIIVGATPDNFYDLVFYESQFGSNLELDNIIIGISQDVSLGYYEVFNWGNNIPDTNTNANVDTLPADPNCTTPGMECDNYEIPTSDLYPGPGTGILIDVDTAPAAPPPNSYQFVIIISPVISGSSGDGAQVDAIVVTEVPISTPTP